MLLNKVREKGIDLFIKIIDGKEHIYIIAEYVNADEYAICKWQSEDFDELLNMIKEWNDTNKIS